MKAESFTTEWLANQKPARRAEIADRGEGSRRVDDRSGLVVRIGPGGASKVFFRWEDARDSATGKVRRRRVRIGAWPAVSLADARKAVLEARTLDRAENSPSADLTVKQIAETYRKDVLTHRERADEAWNIIRVHVVEAQPDPRRAAFGEWPARLIRPADVAAVVRHAKQPRTVESRRLGGLGVARVVLREMRALFAHAVETGSLEMTPAGVLRARSFGLRATSRNRILDAEELKAFFEAIDLTALLEGTAKKARLSETVRLALAFQLYVPLRSHSLIGAKWEEFDLDAARWVVPVERLKLRKEERATARPFTVPLARTAVAILRKLREAAGDSPWVLASPLPPKPKEEPQHVEPKALIRALSRLQVSADEERTPRLAFGSRLTVHDLRRTWRSFAMDLGVDHVVAERSLGHVAALRAAGFSGSADVYGRAQMVEQRARAADLVAAAFDGIRLGKAAEVVPLRTKTRA